MHPQVKSDLDMLMNKVLTGYMIVEKIDRNMSSRFLANDTVFTLREVPNALALMGMGEQSFVDMCREALKGNLAIHCIDIQHEYPVITSLAGTVVSGVRGFIVATVEFSQSIHAINTSMALWSKTIQAASSFMPYSLIPEDGESQVPLKDLGLSIEPIIAFRDWKLERDAVGVYLTSRNDVYWPHRSKLVAECHERVLASHDVPSERCTCGIYAFNKTVDGQKMWYASSKEASVEAFGTVHLWGEILIGPMGFRAEFAYPKEVFLRDNQTRRIHLVASELTESYGVPVTVVSDPLTATMGDTLEELKGGEIQ